jgi:hypothetical protein
MPLTTVRKDVALLNTLTVLKRQRDDLDAAVLREVRKARRAGATWAEIAGVFGKTQQWASLTYGPYPPPRKKKAQPAPSGP